MFDQGLKADISLDRNSFIRVADRGLTAGEREAFGETQSAAIRWSSLR
jgi:hypothetical protein